MDFSQDDAAPEARLQRLGISLPAAPRPFGAYGPSVQSGNLLFLSGTLATENGQARYTGRVGVELDIDTGRRAAHLAATNALALAREHLGSLDRIRRAVRLVVSIASGPELREHPKIADGASELLQAVLGQDRLPCRVVVGVASLPLGSPVLVELLLETVD